MSKYVCPTCKKTIGTYGGVCCGYTVVTPERAAAEWGCFKIMFLIIGIPLILGALIGIGIMTAGQIRNWRDETRTVNTGLTLPLTTTNTTVVHNNNGNVTHYITVDGELRAITRVAFQPDVTAVIDTDVRSIEFVWSSTVFYIKNDNSLWGLGSNAGGLLGTGTGVDVEEPVKIMENVAKLSVELSQVFVSGVLQHRVFAVRTDKTLWMWGRGEFSPIKVTEDVVDFYPSLGWIMVQRSDGLRFRYNASRNELDGRVRPFVMLDYIGQQGPVTSSRGFYISSENALIRWEGRGNRPTKTEIAQNVQSFWGDYNNLFLIKNDGTLWGFGTNALGELGDGTRVPRVDSPVKIAENVVSVGWWHYITADGELWTWNRDNPTPEMVLDNVATVFPRGTGMFNGAILLNDGTLKTNFRVWAGDRIAGASNHIFEGIKIPQILVFE